jgi:hypothetical protein
LRLLPRPAARGRSARSRPARGRPALGPGIRARPIVGVTVAASAGATLSGFPPLSGVVVEVRQDQLIVVVLFRENISTREILRRSAPLFLDLGYLLGGYGFFDIRVLLRRLGGVAFGGRGFSSFDRILGELPECEDAWLARSFLTMVASLELIVVSGVLPTCDRRFCSIAISVIFL